MLGAVFATDALTEQDFFFFKLVYKPVTSLQLHPSSIQPRRFIFQNYF